MGFTSNKLKRQNKKRGFTLVEMIVATGIFGIIMTISIGSLLIIIDSNARAQSLNSAMTNISFAVDSMTRNIRTGYDYYCTTAASLNGNGNLPAGATDPGGSNQDCTTDAKALVFTNQRTGERTAYRFIEPGGDGVIQQKVVTGSWVAITAGDVDIDRTESQFRVSGAEATGDISQPQVDVIVKGEVLNDLNSVTRFSLQTSIVQRVLDF